MVTKEFLRNMPKVELHAHLNGSLSTETLLELGAIVHGETTFEFRKICESFKQIGNLTLSECFKKFQIAHDLTLTKEGLNRATLSVIRDFAQDNVVYLELRTTPKTTPHMSKIEYLQTVLDTISSANVLYPGICVKLIPSIDRSKGSEAAKDTFNTVAKVLRTNSEIIKGIDLSGNPACGSFDDYSEVLTEARNSKLKLALHCAEIENHEETHKMLQFGMDRCGHGTFMSPANLKIIEEKKITIECCLSSNVKCGTVKSYADHHFKAIYFSEYPVVLCTDDSGVFETTLSDEFIVAQETFNLSREDIKKISLNAVHSSFANESEKIFVRNVIEKYFAGN